MKMMIALLFKPAIQPDPWIGVLDATHHRQTCVFFCMIRQGIMGDEDCLYLNVYTPEVNKDARKAVLVFIHPGGFNAGSGDDDVYGPDFLVEQDVVVVTFNSRLGAAGRFALDIFLPSDESFDTSIFLNIANFMKCFKFLPCFLFRLFEYWRRKCAR